MLSPVIITQVHDLLRSSSTLNRLHGVHEHSFSSFEIFFQIQHLIRIISAVNRCSRMSGVIKCFSHTRDSIQVKLDARSHNKHIVRVVALRGREGICLGGELGDRGLMPGDSIVDELLHGSLEVLVLLLLDLVLIVSDDGSADHGQRGLVDVLFGGVKDGDVTGVVATGPHHLSGCGDATGAPTHDGDFDVSCKSS